MQALTTLPTSQTKVFLDMAKKYKELSTYQDGPEPDEDKPADPMRSMRDRYARSVEWDAPLRVMAVDDYRFTFVPGNQWDPWLKKKRARRPTYEFNTTRPFVKQVTNNQRMNRPAVDFSAKQAEGSTEIKQLNDVMSGMFRNDWNVSDGDTALDTAYKLAVTGGFGVFSCDFRFESERFSDSVEKMKPSDFYKEIYWKEHLSPWSIKFDPSAKMYTREDGMFAFEDEIISRDEFKTRFPKADVCSFDEATGFGEPTMADWWMDQTVRISRYWYKEKEEAEVVLMSDGKVHNAEDLSLILDELAAQGITEVARRDTTRLAVWTCLVSGSQELEKPIKWPGKYIPLVPVWGELSLVDGKPYYTGMVRYLRDPQMLKNFHKSVKAELIAKAPKAPFVASVDQIKGHEEMWRNIGDADYSVLLANRDQNGNLPQRSPPPDVPASLIQAGMEDQEDMKTISGIHDPSLGDSKNQSGKAILAEQSQGNTSNFDFLDNLMRSLKYAGVIYADLAPGIYDTTRTRRVLGKDGKESFVQLNSPVLDQQTGQTIYLNDLSQASFDVGVTIGPSFSSQRLEANQMMETMMQNPMLGPQVADLYARTLDSPFADEMEKRIRGGMIKAGVIQPDPEIDGPEATAGPSPQEQQMQMAIQQGQAQMQEMAQALQAAEQQTAQLQMALKAAQTDKEAALIKTQIDGYNAETNRLKVELEAQQANQQIMLDAAERAPTIQANQDWAAVTGALAQQAANTNAPKIKQGRMVRMPDGSYEISVVEGNIQ
jgi:portal protein